MITVDTNVLVYAHHGADPRHGIAKAFLEALARRGERWGIPWPCVVEFLRLASHPKVMAQPLDRVTAAVDRLLGAPGLQVLHAREPAWPPLRAALLDGRAAGNLVFDAQIAALCLSHGFNTIVSEDRDLRRFEGLRVWKLAEAKI